jgi:hypothetical protein
MASSVIAAVCVASAAGPIANDAPLAVTVFWLLALPPVFYAGVWLILGVLGLMWLSGWRPQPPA